MKYTTHAEAGQVYSYVTGIGGQTKYLRVLEVRGLRLRLDKSERVRPPYARAVACDADGRRLGGNNSMRLPRRAVEFELEMWRDSATGEVESTRWELPAHRGLQLAGMTPAAEAEAELSAYEKERNMSEEAKKAKKEREYKRLQDKRLPPVGTRVSKKDREGKEVAFCHVTEKGISYAGEVYHSLSGAAQAALKTLGLKSPTVNGYVFWGLDGKPKKERKAAAPKKAKGNGKKKAKAHAAPEPVESHVTPAAEKKTEAAAA